MKLWGSIRNEVSGAARSLRYDLMRDNSPTQTDIAYPEYDAYSRRPRRFLATGGIAALALGGVAATYFVLSTGLGGLILNSSTNDAPSNPFPAVTNSDGKLVVAPPAKGSNGAPPPDTSPADPPTTDPPDPDPGASDPSAGTSDPGSGDGRSTVSVSASPTNRIVSTSNAIDA